MWDLTYLKVFLLSHFMKINSILAREILDSRGNPTVEVDIHISEGEMKGFGRGVAPSGASTGMHEAVELRDEGKGYLGKGVKKAVENINKKTAPKLIEYYRKQPKVSKTPPKTVDELMLEIDGTKNKSKIGANGIVALSMAYMRALADLYSMKLYKYIFDRSQADFSPGYPGELMNAPPIHAFPEEFREREEKRRASIIKEFENELKKHKKKKKSMKIPVPMLNIINGGKHAGGKLAIQEFMIVPQLKNFKENIQAGSEIYHTLGKILVRKYGANSRNVGDEGGFAPPIDTAEDAFEAILSAVEEAGYSKKIKLAIDAAASSFYREDCTKGEEGIEGYKISGRNINDPSGWMFKDMLFNYYVELAKSYPLISIEDPFFEEDFEYFAKLTKSLKGKCQIVGDDLLVTNPERIRTAIEKKSCNALLLKINQIGTVTEAIGAWRMCKETKWNVIVSHRSGETEDTFIADFSVGIGAEYIKTGAPARGERTAKYNQLLRIEEELK